MRTQYEMYEKLTSVSDDIANPIHYRGEVHDTTRYSTIEVITPCVRIRMEKFEQRKKLSSKRTNRGKSEEGKGAPCVQRPSSVFV